MNAERMNCSFQHTLTCLDRLTLLFQNGDHIKARTTSETHEDQLHRARANISTTMFRCAIDDHGVTRSTLCNK